MSYLILETSSSVKLEGNWSSREAEQEHDGGPKPFTPASRVTPSQESMMRQITDFISPAEQVLPNPQENIPSKCLEDSKQERKPLQEMVKEKWHHLRSNYMREKRKVKELPSGSARKKTISWTYFNEMECLDTYLQQRLSSGNVPD
uniref:MADF domain-containing protein n=1 Tax=Timema douglasi TaxID=61478 RepID=A0A7R8VMS2_TIMDO|nr:unnamed protein product [Timema douglasi]